MKTGQADWYLAINKEVAINKLYCELQSVAKNATFADAFWMHKMIIANPDVGRNVRGFIKHDTSILI